MQQTPMLPKTEEPLLSKPKRKKKIIILVLIILLIIIGLVFAGFFVYKKYFKENNKETTSEDNSLNIEADTQDETANWPVYKTKDFEIKYQKNYETYVKNIQIKTKEQIKKEYEDKNKQGGCPDPCGKLTKDPKLVDKQFELLSKINTEEDISPELENEIKEKFLLLSDANDTKYYVGSVYSDNFDNAGLNLIGYDAYDPGDISKFYYRVAFLVDNKVAMIKFPLYSDEEVKKIMKDFGYNEKEAKCDEKCLKKMDDFSKKVIEQIKNSEFDEILDNNINNYDLMVSTFKFL